MRAAGTRFFIVGVLALFMFIPLFFAGAVINERAQYSRSTASELGREWGGAQVLSGPQLVIPVREKVTTKVRREVIDPETGEPARNAFDRVLTRLEDQTSIVDRAPLYILPNDFEVALQISSEIRKRGIFQVPVYRSDADMRFDFDLSEIKQPETRIIDWDAARITFSLSSNRALRGAATLDVDGKEKRFDPWNDTGSSGIAAVVGDPRGKQFNMKLAFQGAEQLRIAPVGRQTDVTMQSDWPHPSFDGAFLPDTSEVTDAGFTARWTIPHLARALPQEARENQLGRAAQVAFGLRFFQPNDFYQKAYRAARHGILFIALTFLTVLLIEDRSKRPAHPVQYVLIGLVQSMFVVLMVAYAEQIGFGAAYLLATVATVGLLTLYAATALSMGRRALVLGALLSVLYAVLFLILRTADYALIAGSTLVFGALAGTMWVTRNEEWYGENGPSNSLWPRRPKPPVAPDAPETKR